MDRRSFLGALAAAGIVPQSIVDRLDRAETPVPVAPATPKPFAAPSARGWSARIDGVSLGSVTRCEMRREAPAMADLSGAGYLEAVGPMPLPEVGITAYAGADVALHLREAVGSAPVPFELFEDGALRYTTTAYVTEVHFDQRADMRTTVDCTLMAAQTVARVG